jgi:hypothetical protein
MQIDAAGGDIVTRQAEPDGQGRVDEQEAAALVDGIEADRRMLDEIGEALLLAADDRLDLAARRDVLDAPDDVAGQELQRRSADVAPFDLAGRPAHGDLGMAGDAGGGLRLQARQPVGLVEILDELGLEHRLHRRHLAREHAAEGAGGEHDAAVRRDDLARDRQGIQAGGEQVALTPAAPAVDKEDAGDDQQRDGDAAADAAPPDRRDAVDGPAGRARHSRQRQQRQ